MHNLNWDDYRYFLAISRKRSLTAASRTLGVSQPTVSRRLQALEQTLQVRLFNRVRGGYELTREGAELLETTNQIEEQLEQVGRKIFGKDLALKGELRVTCTDFFLNAYLAPHTWQFLTDNPGIDFSVSCTQSVLSLSRRDADIALRFTHKPDDTLAGRCLTRVRYAAYASNQAAKKQFQPKNRDQWHWIGLQDDFYNRMLFGSVFPSGQFKHRVDSMSALHSMTCNGLGVALLPCYAGDRDERLRRVDPEPYPQSTIELWLLYHPDIRKMHRVQLFAEYIRDQIVKDSDLFEGERPRDSSKTITGSGRQALRGCLAGD
jgi:DNA-binding transcriptional LysR family regulator